MVFFAEVISFQSGSSNLVTSGELHSRLFCCQYSTPVSQKQLRAPQRRLGLLCRIVPASFPAPQSDAGAFIASQTRIYVTFPSSFCGKKIAP